jgi:hypothetical protein
MISRDLKVSVSKKNALGISQIKALDLSTLHCDSGCICARIVRSRPYWNAAVRIAGDLALGPFDLPFSICRDEECATVCHARPARSSLFIATSLIGAKNIGAE